MEHDIKSEIKRDYFRAKLLQYTRRAFKMLPVFDQPGVLDIGCGTGVVTLELARLSNGRVIGVDTDQSALDMLNEKIEQASLREHVKTLNCSMKDMQFAEGSFDIIWSEGTIFVIGFEQALKEWRRFLRPEGYLVLHARLESTEQRIAVIPTLGYKLIDKFLVPKEAWWDEYYAPLEKLIEGLRHKYRADQSAQAILDKVQTEVDEFKRKPEHHGSMFYIMQKINGEP